MLIPLALLGCTLEATTIVEDEAPAWTVASLRDAELSGVTVTLPEVVVTSGRTTDETAFYVQDPGGGPGSGMRVELGGVLFGWPPLVGTPVALTGGLTATDDGPVLTLEDIDDTEVLGGLRPVVATPWFRGALGHDVASASGLVVTSDVDPAGHADTNGEPGLSGAFGWTPGWRAAGDAVGIVVGADLALRGPGDWTGDWDGEPPLVTTVEAVRAGTFPEGTPVAIADLATVAPWSVGGRWTVVQDAVGGGLWVDAEGWGVASAEGDVGDWIGEVRTDGEGLRLRVWRDPTVTGARSPIVGDAADGELRDGDVVELTAAGLEGPDPWGDWTAGDLVLDDRFVPLDALPDPVDLTGIVREAPDGPRLAVTERP